MDDSTLIRSFLEHGDDEAVTTLFERYEKGLYNFIWQILRHRQDTEDAMQETLRKTLTALPRYEQQCLFKSWLFRIGHNEAINVIRNRKRVVLHESPEQFLEEAPTPDMKTTPRDQLEQREQKQVLDEAIAKLPINEREVVLLRMQEDMPFKEIARIMDAPIGTVLGRMQNAKQRLKSLLEPSLAQ